MWLLNATTLELEKFHDLDQAPSYAVLSHTWEHDEVTFQDIQDLHSAREKDGWHKILGVCNQTLAHDLQYCWIDTCCINKESSAELAEAIKSMFNVYGCAAICYIYLADVADAVVFTDDLNVDPAAQEIMRSARALRYPELGPDRSLASSLRSFAEARWWSRCWTLQELIAPLDSTFLNKSWDPIARLHDITHLVSLRTGIDVAVLQHKRDPFRVSVAKRLSWAAHRKATRTEDEAYSLFGLLDINLPLFYGEGNRAFARLQEELLKSNSDLSTLAWSFQPRYGQAGGSHFTHRSDLDLFTLSPTDFRWCSDIVSDTSGRSSIHRATLTSTDLSMELPIVPATGIKIGNTNQPCELADLGCLSHNMRVCLVLRRIIPKGVSDLGDKVYSTVLRVELVPKDTFIGAVVVPVFIVRGKRQRQIAQPSRMFLFRANVMVHKHSAGDLPSAKSVTISDAYPRAHWNLSNLAMSHVRLQKQARYQHAIYVGGLALTHPSGNVDGIVEEAFLVFKMERPTIVEALLDDLLVRELKLHNNSRNTTNFNWASFVPAATLSEACRSVEALQDESGPTISAALQQIGINPTLRHVFKDMVVQVVVRDAKARSLHIKIRVVPDDPAKTIVDPEDA